MSGSDLELYESDKSIQIQFAQENFKNIQELIRFIDQKAGAVLVVYGLILTAFIEFSKGLTFINPFSLTFWEAFQSIAILIIGCSMIVLLIYQVYIIIIKVLRPRLALNYKEDEHSIFYFEHIAHMKKKLLSNRLVSISQNQILEEISAQIYEVAKIMTIKTRRLNFILKYLFVNILILLLFILFVEL